MSSPGFLTRRGFRLYGAVSLNHLRTLGVYRMDLLTGWLGISFGLFIITALFHGRAPLVPGRENARYILRYLRLMTCISFCMMPANAIPYKVWQQINSGELSSVLSRPVNYFLYEYMHSLTSAVVMGLLGAVSLVTIQFLTRSTMWPHVGALLVFVPLGFTLHFVMGFCIGLSSFYIEKPMFIRDLYLTFGMLCAGQLFPIARLPALHRVLSFFPFPFLYNVPITSAIEEVSIWQFLGKLAYGMLWICVALGAMALLYRRGVARYASQELR